MALFGKKKEADAVASTDKKVAAKKDEKKDVSYDHDAVLRSPRITEKAAILAERGTYVFDVPMDATKDEVFEAIKHVYNVTPKSISIVRMKQQNYQSRSRGRVGKHKGYKKAYVHVKKGDRIEVM